MTESLHSHENPEPSENPTEWDTLKDVPMNHSETELKAPSDVIDDLQKYMMKEGKIISKETGNEETDEDTILRVKTSRFLYERAKKARDDEAKMQGNRFSDRGPEYYIDKTLDRFGFKDENTNFAEGKLLKELIENGRFHQTIGDNTLEESKFSMLTDPNGQAMLERRLRQHGKTLTDLKINLDDSSFTKNGYSTVDIKLLATEKGAEASAFHHPIADQLNRLEAGLAQAEKDGDEVAINGYKAAIKMAIERHPLEVTPAEWDKMSAGDKQRFMTIKMREAKILGDKDSFNYWNANLKRQSKND